MAGNREGALKGAKTNKEKYGPDFYKTIGAKSWTGERSHKTGFALLSKEKHIEASRKGGLKTKEEYQTKTTDVQQEAGSGTEGS